MAGKTFTDIFPTSGDIAAAIDIIRNLHDKPAEAFLSDETVEEILKRSYNIVSNQLDIVDGNLVLVKDCMYAICVWHSFGAYMNTMGDNLQDSNKFEFMNKLKHYKSIAVGLGNLLGIDISGERIPLKNNPIPTGGTGMSVFKDSEYFDGAYDNEDV